MTLDARRLEMIRENSKLVISELGRLSEIEFGLDATSVAWLEGFVERQRETASDAEEARSRLVAVLACYLGEAIIAAAGGHWDETEDGAPGVRFDNDNWCFPFAKVAKQFADGVEGGESILSFYTVSTMVAARQSFDTFADGTVVSKS